MIQNSLREEQNAPPPLQLITDDGSRAAYRSSHSSPSCERRSSGNPEIFEKQGEKNENIFDSGSRGVLWCGEPLAYYFELGDKRWLTIIP